MSGLIHASLITAAGMATWVAHQTGSADLGEYRAELVLASESGGANSRVTFSARGATLGSIPEVTEPASESRLSDLVPDLAPAEAAVPSPLIEADEGIEALTSGLTRSDHLGASGGGSGRNSGEGGGGDGVGGRGGGVGGPVGALWGVGEGQNAISVVYVLDRSGSMADTFPLLQRELKRAIGSLEADQTFNVIWFSKGPAEWFAPKMVAATLENKRKAFKAIELIVPEGQTVPMEALTKGFALRPDVLFLLSDAAFEPEQERQLTALIGRLNPERGTTVNTILFCYEGLDDAARLFRSIAKDNGGVFKHVTQDRIGSSE